MNPGTLAVLLIFGTLFVAVAGSFLIKALKILKGISPEQDAQRQVEETKLIQEIYQGLARMEERVEALETILFDRQRKAGDQ